MNTLPITLETGNPDLDKQMIDAFQGAIAKTQEWANAALSIVVKDESDIAGMEQAEGAVSALKDLKKEIEANHKRIKEPALRVTQEVDRVRREFFKIIDPALEHAKKQAAFAETMENRRKDELEAKRKAILAPFQVDYAHYDLRNMPEDLFQLTVQGLKAAQVAREQDEAAAKAEQERKAKEEAAERAKLQAEAQKATEEARKANAAVAAIQKAKVRQELLLSRGFRWDGTCFVFGQHAIPKQDVESLPDAQFDALVKTALRASDRDKQEIITFANQLLQFPNVTKGSKLLEACRPGLEKIRDYLIKGSEKL